jgi:5'-nucleotidase
VLAHGETAARYFTGFVVTTAAGRAFCNSKGTGGRYLIKMALMRSFLLLTTATLLVACAGHDRADQHSTFVISVLGTNDVHGELTPQDNRGGLVILSGYVSALRKALDGRGAVLLVDAGDMWQGTLASNLSEGALLVQAYNALGYAAAAVGNHEFDFGPAGPKPMPQSDDDDPRGALRQRASEAAFPLLTANLIDESTGRVVDWDNVRPSTMLSVGPVDVGLIGVLTSNTLATTIAANTTGLNVAPLADAIIREASALRQAGADLVIVLAHAGGKCTAFEDPLDLSSCDPSGEIIRVARELPAGLVDHIVAGHEHEGIAHKVNGIAITASYSNTRAFSRVDFTVDRANERIVDVQIFPPQPNRPLDSYEGQPVVPMASVLAIAERASKLAERRKAEPVGVFLETPMTLRAGTESELGNLMTDALREFTSADIALHNVRGGIRAELPAGELTYGSLYRMYPFDNRIAVIRLSGAEVRKIIATQALNVGRWAGFSGMRVFVECSATGMDVRMQRLDGRTIHDSESLDVAVNDFLLLGGDGLLSPVTPPAGFAVPTDTPFLRDVLSEWFSASDSSLRADQFLDPENARWNLPAEIPANCVYHAG